MAFANGQELRKVVARVQAFKETRQDMVIVALDQVPFKAKIQGGRQLYAPFEVATKAERNMFKEGAATDQAHGGQAQTRGQESTNADNIGSQWS